MSGQVALDSRRASVRGSPWLLVSAVGLSLDGLDYRASWRNLRTPRVRSQATSLPRKLPEWLEAWSQSRSELPRYYRSNAASEVPWREEGREVTPAITPHCLPSQTARTALERSLLIAIRRELTYCLRVVRQYIPLKDYPDIYVVRSNNNITLSGILLPDWISALTIKDTVYILAHAKQWNTVLLKKVLCHELFHAAMYRYFGERKLIPYWFNEAVAHSLVKREFGSLPTEAEDSPKGHYDFKKIGSLPENIHNITSFTFIDYVSTYLLKHYKPHVIRRTLKLTKELGEFEQAIRTILDSETSTSNKTRKQPKAR